MEKFHIWEKESGNPFFFNRKLVEFDTEASALNFLYDLSDVWCDPGLIESCFVYKSEIICEDGYWDFTNCLPEEIEMRDSDDSDWEYRLAIKDKDGVLIAWDCD